MLALPGTLKGSVTVHTHNNLHNSNPACFLFESSSSPRSLDKNTAGPHATTNLPDLFSPKALHCHEAQPNELTVNPGASHQEPTSCGA
jgi:hypothetical protein